jgi:hypothetical protein
MNWIGNKLKILWQWILFFALVHPVAVVVIAYGYVFGGELKEDIDCWIIKRKK